MKKAILGIVGVVVLGVVAFAGYQFIAAGSGEPTTDVTAPPIAQATDAPGDSVAPSFTPGGDAASTTAEVAETSSGELVLTTATATFELDEVLQGSPKHVVGTTSEVAGRVQFDPADLSSAAISDIIINARTLATDSSSRDRAMRSPVVLNSGSDEFELITFSPASIDGLPDSAGIGDEVAFTVTGDLAIKGTTNPVTFDVTVTFVSETELAGVATTTIDRTDWDINIPSVATVADVTEDVLLTLDFTATP